MQRSALDSKSITFGQAHSTSSGQALVIILLVLAVASTVVLSLISRTVTDVAVTTKERESSRAFSAAEAGIEETLSGIVTSGAVSLAPGLTYETKTSILGKGEDMFVSPQELSSGDIFPVWFVSHAADGSLTCSGQPCFIGGSMKVCWGKSGTSLSSSTTPAIEAAVFYKNSPGSSDYSSMRVGRGTYDPNSSRAVSNKFTTTSGSCSIGNSNYAFGQTINFSDLGISSSVYNTAGGLQTARIRLFYNTDTTQPVGVNVFGGTLPAQGTIIESTGKSEETTRKIQVFNLYSDLPPIFDFAVFSGGNLQK